MLLVHYIVDFETVLFLLLLAKDTKHLNIKYFIITQVFDFIIFVFRRAATLAAN